MDNTNFEELTSLNTCKLLDSPKLPIGGNAAKKLCLMNLNIRGLESNFAALKCFLTQLNQRPDIIVITESHLDNISAPLIHLDGYRTAYNNRSSHGGGLLVFINSNILFEIKSKMTGLFNSHESLAIEINMPKRQKINIICIYRPPDKKFIDFLNYFKSIEKFLKTKKVILVGA